MNRTIQKHLFRFGGICSTQSRTHLTQLDCKSSRTSGHTPSATENERREVVEEKNETSLNVYPNPTNGNCLVKYSGIPYNAIFQVTDISGKVLIEQTINDADGMFNLKLSSYSNGIYLYKLKGDCCSELNGKIILVK